MEPAGVKYVLFERRAITDDHQTDIRGLAVNSVPHSQWFVRSRLCLENAG